MPDLGTLAALARALLPASVAVAASDPAIDHPRDPDTPPGAVPGRAREFAAGRIAARAALHHLGLPPARIPMSADRAPLWPAGLTGSITHSARACLAAVARRSDILSLGLDLAEEGSVTEDLWTAILLPEERAWLATQPAPRRRSLATVLFSAKEASYKAQYPISRTLIRFRRALRLALRMPERFAAEFRQPVGPFVQGQRLQGQAQRHDGHVLTVVWLPNP